MIRMFVSIFALSLFLVCSCSRNDGDRSGGETPTTSNEEKLPPTGALSVKGSLSNGDNPENTSVSKNQKVELVRNDGIVIGTGKSDSSSNFAISVIAGSLSTSTAFRAIPARSSMHTLVAASTPTATSAEDLPTFQYYIQSSVANDGSGKAIGVKKRIPLSKRLAKSVEGDVTTFDAGENKLTEISAITGSVTFADPYTTKSSTDVYIPGKSFFARTGDDGAFQLMFVPVGTYKIRLQKAVYIKEVEVTVAENKTTKLGNVTVAASDRNPQPLAEVVVGTWNTSCFYYDMAGGISPESPLTGVIRISSLSAGGVAVVSGISCFARSNLTPVKTPTRLLVPSDGSLILKFDDGSYSVLPVASYTNNRITLNHTPYVLSSNAVEVFERTP